MSSFVILLYILHSLLSSTTAANLHSRKSRQIIHDSVAPVPRLDAHGLLSSSSPLPDWSDVKLDGKKRYVEVLLAIDAAVSRHYGHNRDKIITAMNSLMHAVNMYTYQLNLHVIVVDVVAVRGYNLSLDQFLQWRQETADLTPHDVAMLVRHRYEGGIAYVNGACKRTAVGVCGFFPEAPFEYASVFFHELAHLLGLSHDMTADCRCSKQNRHSCLRIDGFEKDCSVQALVDLLPSLDCLGPPMLPLPRTTVSLCGNGVLEDDEDCDCGPHGYCDNVLCEARSCQFVIPRKYLYSTFTFGVAVGIFLFLYVARRACVSPATEKMQSSKSKEAMLTPIASPRKMDVDVEKQSRSAPMSPQRKSACTETTVFPECALLPFPGFSMPHGPNFGRLPKLSLDNPVPLPDDEDSIPADYVKMNPAKIISPKPKHNKEVRLPAISPTRRIDISEPVATIVAGRPAADYLTSEDALSATQTLNRAKPKTNVQTGTSTMPRPALPDRKLKQALVPPKSLSLRDCPTPVHRNRLYDLPPLDSSS